MKYGDKGDDVQDMQEALLNHGYTLPRFGADGDFGAETLRAIRSFQRDRGIPQTDDFDATLDALGWDVPKDDDVLDIPPPQFGDIEIYDLRDEQTNPPALARKFKLHRGKVVIRDPAQITGITIHQTAAKYGIAEYQIRAAGGDAKLALARRSLRVACHTMAFADGFVAWPNPLNWYVYHGNGFNAFELGLEIDGNYPGVIGGQTWNKRTPTQLTDKTIRAACAAIELMVINGRKMGMPLDHIHAHRQSSATRRDDPGEELWRNVVLDYAVHVLGLKTEPTRTLRNGRPIPVEWDANGLGHY